MSKVLGLLTISLSLCASQPNGHQLTLSGHSQLLTASRNNPVVIPDRSTRIGAELIQAAHRPQSNESPVISSPQPVRYVIFRDPVSPKGKEKAEDEESINQPIPQSSFGDASNLDNSAIPFRNDSPVKSSVGNFDFYDNSSDDEDEGASAKALDIINQQGKHHLQSIGVIPKTLSDSDFDDSEKGSSSTNHYALMDDKESEEEIASSLTSSLSEEDHQIVLQSLLKDVSFPQMSKDWTAKLMNDEHYSSLKHALNSAPTPSTGQTPAQQIARMKKRRLILMGIVGGVTVASIAAPAAYLYFGHPEMAKNYWERFKQKISQFTANWGVHTALTTAGTGAFYSRLSLLKK